MRAPLSRKPLGLSQAADVVLAGLLVASLLPGVSCSRSASPRFVDRRLDAKTYFIQEVWPAGLSKADAEAKRRSVCHGAAVTLHAGYDYYVTMSSPSPEPDVELRPGETVAATTLKMFKGLPRPGEDRAMDAHLLHQACK